MSQRILPLLLFLPFLSTAEPLPEPSFSRGEGPGWVTLTGEDFVNVNCLPDTWKWVDGHAYCTGKPWESRAIEKTYGSSPFHFVR